jgi:hypothetical protein
VPSEVPGFEVPGVAGMALRHGGRLREGELLSDSDGHEAHRRASH